MENDQWRMLGAGKRLMSQLPFLKDCAGINKTLTDRFQSYLTDCAETDKMLCGSIE